LAAAVRQESQRMLDQGLEAGELDRVKTRMLSSAIFARDEMKTGAYTLGSALAAGHTIGDVEEWPERVGAVTEQDVLNALRALLDEPRQITTKLLPEDTKPGGGS
jgi:zinc protease